jgi:hypothetical protein
MIDRKFVARKRILTTGDFKILYRMEIYLKKKGCTFHRTKGEINYIVKHPEIQIEITGDKPEDVKFECVLRVFQYFQGQEGFANRDLWQMTINEKVE